MSSFYSQRPFEGLAERLKGDIPTSRLLSGLQQQQKGIEAEMQQLKAELDYAMQPTSVAREGAFEAKHNRALSPPNPMSSFRSTQYTQPVATTPVPQAAHIPSVPTPATPAVGSGYSGLLGRAEPASPAVWEEGAPPAPLDYPYSFQQENLAYDRTPGSPTPLYDSIAERAASYKDKDDYVPDPAVRALEKRESRWNNSIAVEAFTPHKKKLRVGERPEPLYTGSRPKSDKWYKMKGQRKDFPSEDEEYLPDSPRQRAQARSRSMPKHVPTRSAYSRYRPVRSRSPDMDLVTRPPKYFDEGLATSTLSMGGVLDDLQPRASVRTPLRGEMSPVATRKGGLWATMPHTAKQLTRKYTGFTR